MKIHPAICIILLLCSCNHRSVPADNEINAKHLMDVKEADVFAQDVFKKVFIIHPENCKDGLFSKPFHAEFYKDYLILHGSGGVLQVYDKQGKFIFKTSKGKGPGELIQIADFTVNYDTDEIYVTDGFKCLRLSLLGEGKGSFSIKPGTFNIGYVGQGKFCSFIPFNSFVEDGINYDFLYVSDSTGELLYTKKMKREIHSSPFLTSRSFNYCPNGVLFHAPYWDTIIKATPDGFFNDKILNYCGMKMPEEYLENLDLHRKHSQENFEMGFLFAKGKTFLFYSYRIKGAWGTVIYDQVTRTEFKTRDRKGQDYGIQFGNRDNQFLVWPQSVNSDYSLIMEADIKELSSFAGKFKNENIEFYDDLVRDLNKLDTANDNPVIIIGILK